MNWRRQKESNESSRSMWRRWRKGSSIKNDSWPKSWAIQTMIRRLRIWRCRLKRLRWIISKRWRIIRWQRGRWKRVIWGWFILRKSMRDVSESWLLWRMGRRWMLRSIRMRIWLKLSRLQLRVIRSIRRWRWRDIWQLWRRLNLRRWD